MKGLFIPEITAEMFRSGCLESIEALMAEGEIYDIDYPLGQDPVLDKIRAKIIENSIEDYKYHGCGTEELIIETSEVLEIIDKYKAESESV